MTSDEWHIGDMVRVAGEHRRGVIHELDPEYFVARIRLNAGGEEWVRFDELERIPVWDRTTGTQIQSGAQAA